MNLFDAEMLAKELISQYVPNYRFGWMNEKRTNGRCFYNTRTIKLSQPLTQLRTKEAVKNTIMHEIAHALTPGAGHGRLWKLQMLKFGLKPDRCSSDDVDLSTIANWRATCIGCGKVVYMIRKPRVIKACRQCCGSKYNDKYRLTFYQI
jgi:predicted SprT family Zn-dependent metalloprotease